MIHKPFRVALALALPIACLPLAGCEVEPKRTETMSELAEFNERARMAEELAVKAQKAMDRGDTGRAIELYRESIEYSAEFPDTWNNLGLLLLEGGDLKKAMSAFSRAADLDPSDPRAFYNMGITNLRAEWAEYAIEDFKKALDITPSYLPALRGAIQSADLLGRAEYEDLDRVKRALLTEKNPDWRAYFERQRYLIEARIKSARSYGSGGMSD